MEVTVPESIEELARREDAKRPANSEGMGALKGREQLQDGATRREANSNATRDAHATGSENTASVPRERDRQQTCDKIRICHSNSLQCLDVRELSVQGKYCDAMR